MPTSLTFDEHLSALQSSGERLLAVATAAGLDAPVPTCPAWDVRALLAHQTMVHRWATAHVRKEDPDSVANETWIRTSVGDLPAYYAEGHASLVAALRAAPPDLEAMRFLNDAPAPRQFWARRQAHETMIHMVDALAAARAGVPGTDECTIDAVVAADGVDELLAGFFTRGQCQLYAGADYTIVVAPTDVDRRWLLRVGPTLTVEAGGRAGADAAITGTAAGIYLALWNRGDDVTLDGRPEVLDQWRATQRVRWS